MINFFKKNNNKIKRDINLFKINPHKHWNLLVYIFFILAILLILFSFYLLFEIKNDQIFQVKMLKKEDQTLLKEDLFNNITNLYDKKESRVLEINNGPSVYSDPSL